MGTETTGSSMQWVYDFNSFTAPIADVDLTDIEANPEKYLDYDPNIDEIAALRKENAELRENVNLLSDCVMEITEQVYS